MRLVERRIPMWVGLAATLVVVAITGLWALQSNPIALEEYAAMSPESETAFDRPTASAPGASAQPDAEAVESEEMVMDAIDGTASMSEASGRALRPPSPEEARSATRGAEGLADDQQALLPSPVASLVEPVAPMADEVVVADDQLVQNTPVPVQPEPAMAQSASVETAPVEPRAAWEAGEDVRLLSIRLQEMALSSEGMGWDEPPVPLGQPTPAGLGSQALRPVLSVQPGMSKSRDGALTPARIEVRMRAAPQQDP